MPGSGGAVEREKQVPRLAPGWERCGLSLSPAEGFLLSRIDGVTPWMLLREIGGLAPGEADRCLERWIGHGVVLVDGLGEGEEDAASAGEVSSPGGDLQSPIDPALEIPVEAQRRVLAFEAGLRRPYHQLLGVTMGVEGKTIKRAYFQLSKEFHPDRYYRKRIGPYAQKLDAIFKKIVEAYELLMDPTTRAELERSMAGSEPEPEPAAAEPPAADAERPAPPVAAGPSAGRRALERLRRQFRIPDAILAERRARARDFHAASLVALRKQRWLEAASNSRLAIAFDPWNEEYKKRFAEVQAKASGMRVDELLERAEKATRAGAVGEALRLFEEALHYRPHDPAVNHRAAEHALESGDLARAREYAERACELRPDVSAHQRSLGQVLAREGLREKAIAALERALALDPKDKKAQDEIRKLRRGPRRGLGGRR
jgi:curved DNA-binding protein CbpA